MLSLLAALTLSAAAVPAVEYKVERLGSKEVLLEGNAPLELQRSSKFEHSNQGNAVSMSMVVRPTDKDERVTMDLKFSERAQNGARHEWEVTVVLLRGVATTSDVSWGEGGWRVRLKVG